MTDFSDKEREALILDYLQADTGGGHIRGHSFAFTSGELAYALKLLPVDAQRSLEAMAAAGTVAFDLGHYSLPRRAALARCEEAEGTHELLAHFRDERKRLSEALRKIAGDFEFNAENLAAQGMAECATDALRGTEQEPNGSSN